jgi:hypothetical protein
MSIPCPKPATLTQKICENYPKATMSLHGQYQTMFTFESGFIVNIYTNDQDSSGKVTFQGTPDLVTKAAIEELIASI